MICNCEADQTHVGIINNLDGKINLQVHCKSKDDDLGIHVIPYLGKYEFSFKYNLRDTTLFFCGFKWDANLHWFDIYSFNRDANVCQNDCMWNIQETGPCRVQGNSCYPWNNN
ncbi:S-protein-like protein 5 [Bienertia sinuspersici]